MGQINKIQYHIAYFLSWFHKSISFCETDLPLQLSSKISVNKKCINVVKECHAKSTAYIKAETSGQDVVLVSWREQSRDMSYIISSFLHHYSGRNSYYRGRLSHLKSYRRSFFFSNPGYEDALSIMSHSRTELQRFVNILSINTLDVKLYINTKKQTVR